jgi:hypothetical protein
MCPAPGQPLGGAVGCVPDQGGWMLWITQTSKCNLYLGSDCEMAWASTDPEQKKGRDTFLKSAEKTQADARCHLVLLEGKDAYRQRLCILERLRMSGLASPRSPVQLPPRVESLPCFPAACAPHCVDDWVTGLHSRLIPAETHLMV